MDETIVIKEETRARFLKEVAEKAVIFFAAPAGYGKTAVVKALLAQIDRSVVWISCRGEKEKPFRNAEKGGLFSAFSQDRKSILVFDDIQLLEEQQESVLAWYGENAAAYGFSVILLSRSELPSAFHPMMLRGEISIFRREDMELGAEEIQRLSSHYLPRWPDRILNTVLWKAQWEKYPLAVKETLLYMQQKEEEEPFLKDQITRELFQCYDAKVYFDLTEEEKLIALEMADFESFTVKMAELVTGRDNADQLIENIAKKTNLFYRTPAGNWEKEPIFSMYISEKQKKKLSLDTRKSGFHKAGLYYELEGEIHKALDCYHQCGEYDKIIELLLENSRMHPGIGHYYEMEPYYRSLPEKIVCCRPQMMCGMSMLCSICMQIEQSEYWYHKLEVYAEKQKNASEAYNDARRELLYLSIALPHRGSWSVLKSMFRAQRFSAATGLELPEMSVTGNLPSLMSGGKDFCRWSKTDRALYRTVKKTIEKALGRYGAGLGDIALSESLFEKGEENSYELMLMLNRGLSEAEARGTEELCFAAKGLMARIYISQGELRAAEALITAFLEMMQQKKKTYLVPNIKAFLIRLALLKGDETSAAVWMKYSAPDEKKRFYTMKRYEYLTKVRCYIMQGRLVEAMDLLSRFGEYAIKYDRTYEDMEQSLLTAIVLYRMGNDKDWKLVMRETLRKAERFGFIRFIAEQGAAVKPLLDKLEWRGEKRDFSERLIKAVNQQAAAFPDYLSPKTELLEPLTKMERTVLKLIAQGMKNDDMADALGISSNTIKFHIKNLYSKLNAKNRTQVLKHAKRYGILQDSGD